MTAIVYDGTFAGFLTLVFEVYEHKFINVTITPEGRFNTAMFVVHHKTLTNEAKAARVWKGLSQKVSAKALSQVYKTFLSEEKRIEIVLLQYIQYVFANTTAVENNFAHNAVLRVNQTAKKVDREKHRMEAFVRFQLTKDQLYYAICQPDFNVLPLIETHFKDRYADQRWLIYDSKRKFGIYYDLQHVERVHLSFSPGIDNGNNIAAIADEQEEIYQKLWQCYFNSVNIAARKNMKLHIQHMPKRYWNYLPEKHTANRNR